MVKHHNSSCPMWPLLWILMKRFPYLRGDRCGTLKMSTVCKLFRVTHRRHEPHYHLSWILLLGPFCSPMSEFHFSTKIHQILIFLLLFPIKIFQYNQDFPTPLLKIQEIPSFLHLLSTRTPQPRTWSYKVGGPSIRNHSRQSLQFGLLCFLLTWICCSTISINLSHTTSCNIWIVRPCGYLYWS